MDRSRAVTAVECERLATRRGLALALSIALGLCWAPALVAETNDAAEEPAEEETAETAGENPETPVLFERLRVNGAPDRSDRIPGSVNVIDEETLARQSYGDIHRILSLVPGVSLQDEDGYGLRPNIGIRGTGSERSQKITLMEDGVLIAPAPYSAPSAYYFPTAGRMEGIEVRKGSGSIQHGPFTTGGVLNLLSSSIPSTLGGAANLAIGDDDMFRGRVRLGDSRGRFGWLVETYQAETDGFKELDGGGPTGYDIEDYLVKFRVTSATQAPRFQALEVKLGKTDQFGNETYLGLTSDDFDRNPYRRYRGSREDKIDSEHEQVQLRYFLRASESLDLTATAYHNDFYRNWHKLQSVQGISITNVLNDPAGNAGALDILRGDADSAPGELAVRNNRRNYFSRGVNLIAGIRPRAGHEIETGVRYHEDEEDRFQEEDLFRMVAGEMSLTAPGAPGSNSNRVSSAEAVALFAQDTITRGRWVLTPGVRFESIRFERLDFGNDDPARTGVAVTRKSSKHDVLIPGFGVSYKLDADSRLFAGVHRGFAPPGPGADNRTDPEDSLNYEIGYRYYARPLKLQMAAFYNDYDNLLGTDTVSAGGSGSGDTFNGGAARVRGFEAGVEYDPGIARAWRYRLPLNLSYTYTEAEFLSTFESDFEGWGDEVRTGDELPYLPSHQGALSAGLIDRNWSMFLNLAYQDAARTEPGQGAIPAEFSTDARWVADLTVNYHLRSELKLYVQVRNLTDEQYVVARRPAGLRPGLPRTVLAGVGWDF